MGKGLGYFTGYPKHVFFILGNEFCERFSFYGMKAILVLYFTRALNYDDDTATAIYHAFNSVCYFMPIFGAMLADGYLGKFRTILYLSIVYSLGNLVMSIGAIPQGGSYFDWVTYIALVLIAIGTGGIKPCVSAFGADQFTEEQGRQKETFFSMFYMSINLGSLLSMIITPILRSSVQCFDDDCYALAFGVPACLMVVAVVFFVVGSAFYTKPPPGNNIIGRLFGCIGTAVSGRCKKRGGPKEHWLDYSEEKYGKEFVTDVKAVMRVLFMFIPLPVFWALFDQQGSRWILQAGRMNGDLGGFVMEPDQMQVINPLLVVIMVPLVESLMFPCLDKLRIPNRPLQRLGAGLLLCSLSFCITGGIEITINKTAPPSVPDGMTRAYFVNGAPCEVSYHYESGETFQLAPQQAKTIEISHSNAIEIIEADFTGCSANMQQISFFPSNFTEVKGFAYVFSYLNGLPDINQYEQDNITRVGGGMAVVQVINNLQDLRFSIDSSKDGDRRVNLTHAGNSSFDLRHDEYTLSISTDYEKYTRVATIDAKAGAVYSAVIQYAADGNVTAMVYEEVPPNDVNIFLQLPQYIVMSFGEVLFSVTGLSFAYSQAPPSMKAVLQAAWLVTNAVGNLIVVIVSSARIPDQVAEYFFFAGLMFVTFIIFCVMAIFYVYVEDLPPVEEEDDEKKPPLEGEVNAAYVNENALDKEKEAEAEMSQMDFTPANELPVEEPPVYQEVDPESVTSTAF